MSQTQKCGSMSIQEAPVTEEADPHQKICPIYASIFHTARIFGILPYSFNPTTLELTPVTSGFSYFVFLLNLTYLFGSGTKCIVLFLRNWMTNFELEEIQGGYFMQLSFCVGHMLLFAMVYGYTFHKNMFGEAVTSSIRLQARIIHEFPSKATLERFRKRCNFLRLQFLAYNAATMSGASVFFIMEFFVPELPQNIDSILKTRSTAVLLLLTMFESYVFPLGLGIITVSNTLIYITFGGITAGVSTMNTILKDPIENYKRNEVNNTYQLIQLVINQLTTAFSVSFLFQELTFLLDIIFLIMGAVKMAELGSISLVIFSYGTAVEFCFLIAFQFYPMIMMNLYSKDNVALCKSLMGKDKISRAMARRSCVLKVRPMGVHTITLATLCDYAVFVASMLLMFLKA